MKYIRNNFRVAKRMQKISLGVEFHDRRRLMSCVQFVVGQVTAIENKHVVVRVDADSANTSRYPKVGKWLGPTRVEFEVRRPLLGVGRA